MNDIKKGEQIIRAVYKSALGALFAIGIRSSSYIDHFTNTFSSNLDKEFLKLGLLNQKDSDWTSEKKPVEELKKTKGLIEELKLHIFTESALKKANIKTVEDLLSFMQKESLLKIKRIGNKSAKEIIKAIEVWNKP